MDHSDPIVARYPVAWIVQRWMDWYKMDVSHFFAGLSELSLRRDPQTLVEYFTPSSTAGDGAFYAALQEQPGYYLAEKWEYTIVLAFLANTASLLEVGCGTGVFLQQYLAAVGDRIAVGVELNRNAVRTARENGLNVRSDSLEDLAAAQERTFDAVCAFQVLEHVVDPLNFLASSSRLLKRGGILVIAVPNNASFFIGQDHGNILNMPPHHLIRWTPRSLSRALQSVGEWSVSFHYQPLERSQIETLTAIIAESVRRLPNPLPWLLYRRSFRRFCGALLRAGLWRLFLGHTVLAVARKLA
jgi:2-polyprenyl-3-methyl-5-hydroxy-6-metoxy-1,4-benzoquinol methylase